MPPWISPPADPLLSPGEVHLWRFPLDLSLVNLSFLKSFLSPDEAQRAERLLDHQKAQAFVVGRGRLRQILGSYLHCQPSFLDFAYNIHGKPALKSPRKKDLSFNLSHSGEWGVLALTTGAEIGVDLEQSDPLLDYARLAARFFSAAENSALAGVQPQRRRRAFYRLWTRKEALLKGEGRGFSSPDGLGPRGWTMRSFWLAPGYVAAVACNGGIHSVQRWQVG